MSERKTYLNELAAELHAIAASKGWHDPPPSMSDFAANIHGEVSELFEAYRADGLAWPCDKAEKMSEPLTCLEEEVADILIRTLDMAAALGVDVDRAVRVKTAFNRGRGYRHGNKVA